ncbi:unnamed protein product, partial [Effrenium voratum]
TRACWLRPPCPDAELCRQCSGRRSSDEAPAAKLGGVHSAAPGAPAGHQPAQTARLSAPVQAVPAPPAPAPA